MKMLSKSKQWKPRQPRKTGRPGRPRGAGNGSTIAHAPAYTVHFQIRKWPTEATMKIIFNNWLLWLVWKIRESALENPRGRAFHVRARPLRLCVSRGGLCVLTQSTPSSTAMRPPLLQRDGKGTWMGVLPLNIYEILTCVKSRNFWKILWESHDASG